MTSKTLPKPPESNIQVQEYMAAVRKGVNSQFVIQTSGGWSVRPAVEPSKAVFFASKDEALQKAKAAAKAKRGEVFVFDHTGSLISQESAAA
jgi:uncharacterized protein DUF2188